MKEIIKKLSQEYGKDERVIKLICFHPLLFTKHKMEDPNDLRPIMITYFAKFIPKWNKTLDDKKLSIQRYLYKKTIAIDRIKNSIK